MRDVFDERGDLVLADLAIGQGGRAVGGDVAHHLFDLVFGQRGGAQQRQQRNPVGAGNTFGVAGSQPVQDRVQKRRGGHAASVVAGQWPRQSGFHSSPVIHRAFIAFESR